MARIAGLLDLHLMTAASMSEGRFIGRIESEGSVEQMGIVRGTTYVWIDDHDRDGQRRALFFPDWDRPMDILRPTLDSLASPPIPRGTRPRLIFESLIDVFPLAPGMCEPDRTRGTFWAQDDPAGYDTFERFMGDDGGLGGCYPCDCTICCIFHPIGRNHGADFPTGFRPLGRVVR